MGLSPTGGFVQDELESAEIVSRAVDRIQRQGRQALFTLSNGIVIRLKPVPPMLMQAVNNSFEAPNPPKIMMEEKGREEENPNDPDYLNTLVELAKANQLAVENLMYGVGTEFVSAPEGYYGPDDDRWIEQVEFASRITGVELTLPREDKTLRYIFWLKMYAMEHSIDVVILSRIPSELGGIREGEVDEVIESFRRVPKRGDNNESAPEPGSKNGNPANRASRRSRARN